MNPDAKALEQLVRELHFTAEATVRRPSRAVQGGRAGHAVLASRALSHLYGDP